MYKTSETFPIYYGNITLFFITQFFTYRKLGDNYNEDKSHEEYNQLNIILQPQYS